VPSRWFLIYAAQPQRVTRLTMATSSWTKPPIWIKVTHPSLTASVLPRAHGPFEEPPLWLNANPRRPW
jgi:hypothetical protein